MPVVRGLQDADAADVSQEVMGKVARAIRTFEYRPEQGRFRDWLFTITRQRLAQFHECRAQLPEQLPSSVELEQLGRGTDRPDADWTDDFNAQVLEVALDRARPALRTDDLARVRARLARKPFRGGNRP